MFSGWYGGGAAVASAAPTQPILSSQQVVGSGILASSIRTAPVLYTGSAASSTAVPVGSQVRVKVPPSSAASGYTVGEAVEYYSATQSRWIPAKVLDVNSNGTYGLDCKPDVTADKIRRPSGGGDGGSGDSSEYAVGDVVEYYSASQSKWIMAKVQKVKAGGLYDLDCKPDVPADKVRPTHRAGSLVEYYSTSQGSWIPAKVVAMNANGTFELDCKPDVPLDKIRRATEKQRRESGGNFSATKWVAGDEVEYFSATQANWIPAKVVSVNSSGTYDLDCKPDVQADKIRGRSAARDAAKLDGSTTAFRTGEIVEYLSATQGRWIPAKVVAANADGSYELDCKPDVPAERIRRPSSGSGDREAGGPPLAAAAPPAKDSPYKVGDAVEYFGATQSKWIPTTVVKVNANGTFDLACKPAVAADKVRFPPPGASAAAGAGGAHNVGDVVEYFGATLGKWIPAKVVAVKGGSYDLDCKPGAPADKVRRPLLGGISPSRRSCGFGGSGGGGAIDEMGEQTPHTPGGYEKLVPLPGLAKPVPLLSARKGSGGAWRYEVCPEGASALERLGSRRVAVVSVCGLRRTGKTTLTDALQGGGQKAVSSRAPGIWLSAATGDGDEQGPVLAFLDCDGFGGAADEHKRDAQLLAFLSLLSSALLINSTGDDKQQQRQQLGDAQLAALAPACRFGEDIEERGNEASRPMMIWTLRDVGGPLLDGRGQTIQSDEYLESCLHAPAAEDTESGRAARETRRGLLHFFKRRGCVALPPLSARGGAFKAAVARLRERVVEACLDHPKMVGGQPLSCFSLVQLLRQLASAATDARVLNIKAAWETVQHTTCGTLADELREYASKLLRDLAAGRPVPGGAKLPMTDDELNTVLRARRRDLKDQWEERAVGDEHVRREYWQELKESLAREEGLVRAQNSKLADQEGMEALRSWQDWLDAQEGSGEGGGSGSGAAAVGDACKKLGRALERMPARPLSRVGRAAIQAAARRVASARAASRHAAEQHGGLHLRAVELGEKAAQKEGVTRTELEAKRSELATIAEQIDVADQESGRRQEELSAKAQELQDAEAQLRSAVTDLEAARAREREQAARHRAQVTTLESLQNELEQVRAAAARDDAQRLAAERLTEAGGENAAGGRRRLEEALEKAKADASRFTELLAAEKNAHEGRLADVRAEHEQKVESAQRQLLQERETLQAKHTEMRDTHQKKVEDARREVEEQRKAHTLALDDQRGRLLEKEHQAGLLEGKLSALSSEAEMLRTRLRELEEQAHKAQVLAEERQHENGQLERELVEAKADATRHTMQAEEQVERMTRAVETFRQVEEVDPKIQGKGCGISLRRMVGRRRAAEAGA